MITAWKIITLVAFAAALVFLILGIVSLSKRNAQRRRMVESIERERSGYINDPRMR